MYQRCVKLRINPEFKNYKKLPPNAIVDSAPKVTRISEILSSGRKLTGKVNFISSCFKGVFYFRNDLS